MYFSKLLNRQLHRFNQLSITTKNLLKSNLLYAVADLLVFTFAHAYLFTQTDSFYSVLIFNLGYYISLPLAFFLNALLLKHTSVKTLFSIGLIGQGLVMCALVFLPSLSLPIIFLFSFVFGIPMGFYWANRNFLIVADIPDKQRNYFAGIDGAFGETMSVLIPFIAGWFIALTAHLGVLPKTGAYQVIMVLGTVFFILSALTLRKSQITTPIIHTVSLRRVSKDWRVMRIFILFAGIQMVISSALPTALILYYLGNEGVLGTVQAFLSLVVALGLYWVGKRTGPSDRYRILYLSVVPLLLSAMLLLMQFSTLTVSVFLLLQAIANGFLWFVYFPVLSQVIERQDHGSVAHNYRYVLDHEVMVNISRIITTLVIIGLFAQFPPDRALTISVALVAISQIGMLVAAKKLLVSP